MGPLFTTYMVVEHKCVILYALPCALLQVDVMVLSVCSASRDGSVFVWDATAFQRTKLIAISEVWR